jgi:hypothetical protein
VIDEDELSTVGVGFFQGRELSGFGAEGLGYAGSWCFVFGAWLFVGGEGSNGCEEQDSEAKGCQVQFFDHESSLVARVVSHRFRGANRLGFGLGSYSEK